MSKLANLSALLLDPAFQRQIQTEIRRKAAEHNSSIIYQDEKGRTLVEYPGSGQIYEQTEDKQLILLSVAGQAVAAAAPISRAEANKTQAT